MTPNEILEASRFLLITDRNACKGRLAERIEQACRAGVRMIQLREKDLAGKALYELASELKQVSAKYGATLLINDRVDIALAVDAGGVHLPENGLPVGLARKIVGKRLIGRSTHSLEGAISAEKEGADYVIFGPVFETPSKVKFGAAQGLEKLEAVCSQVKIPVFAVGGISPERVPLCLKAGAHGVAAIRAIMESDHLEDDLTRFKQELGRL
ncbi:MAG: thiamine phosphate synthase [Chlorobiales bacterium]|nr:thiamine phosphate synthase [Chlorobiales bacterium]